MLRGGRSSDTDLFNPEEEFGAPKWPCAEYQAWIQGFKGSDEAGWDIYGEAKILELTGNP